MKKILALLLVLAMTLSLAACGSENQTTADSSAEQSTEAGTKQSPETTEAAPTEAASSEEETTPAEPEKRAGLPDVGDVVEGFAVKEIRDFPLYGASLVLFEHERTGAQLMYIANDDTNRVFDLTFFTRAIDNTGLPHVFEHSTTDGSKKYPSKALFFNLSYQTYNTYMNALTMPLCTSYPVASLSEEQLLKYADYYTDSCFYPMIMEKESIYREEAWRYRLPDAESDLTIEGTVYSEMLGAYDLDSAAATNLLRDAFPGSTIGNVAGGEPVHIPEMTWESLKAYHDQFYHPSNCIAYLYGQFDHYEAFLKLLDEAYAPFEKKEFAFADADYTPLTASVDSAKAFPVEAGSDTENASSIYYAFICPGAKDDPKQELLLNTLTDLMTADGSVLMQSLKKALPSGRFATYIELDGPEDMIVFYAQNVNQEDKDTFKATVDAALADIVQNGFSDDLVDGIVASLELSTKLAAEGDDIGVELIQDIASYHSAADDPFGYMGYVDALSQLRDWNSQGLYKKAAADWLGSGAVTVLSATYPEAGLREKLDAEEAGRLAEVKAAMSEEEIKALVEQTNAQEEEEDTSAMVKELQAVTVASLPEEIRTYEISDETGADGVLYVNAEAGVDGVGSPILLLDASGLSMEEIHWFALFVSLVGEMDTTSHSKEELAILSSRYLYEGETRLSLIDKHGTDEFRPNLRASWTAADEDLAAGYDLIYEILFETDFSDAETLKGLITQKKAALKSSINNSPYNAMLYRALGYYSPLYRYYSYFNSFDYYTFLGEAETLVDDYAPAVIKQLQRIQNYFRNRTNAIALYAGSKEGIAVNKDLAAGFMAKLDAREITPAALELPVPAKNEALIVDSSVSYNGIVADYKTLGMDGYTGDLDAVSSLLADAYLYPMLRDQYGAYSVMAGFMEDNGAYLVTYRDPNIQESFAVYEKIPEFMGSLEKTQEEVDGYILSSYAYYAKATGELSGAKNAALSQLTGEGQDQNLQFMRDLKTLTPDKLKDYAEVYKKMTEEGVRFTAGGASAINENEAIYDEILNPFGAKDSSEVVFEDLPEDHEHYEAVRFVFEEGYMQPAEETVFGVDQEATVGDMAVALFTLGFGEAPADAAEAVEGLAEYDIVSASADPAEKLTGKDAETILAAFSKAVQVSYSKNGDASESPITRGELAELLKAYIEPLME